MEVLYWQLAVAGTTGAAYLFGTRKVGLIVAVAWTVWTFVMLSYGPLVAFQLLSAWGTFVVIDLFTAKARELDQFKQAVQGYQDKDRQLLLRARETGPVFHLTDADHYSFLLSEIEKATSRILILSGWISDKVVDHKFIDAVTRALSKGVSVYLGFGFEDSKGAHELSRPAKRALRALSKLSRQHKNIHVGKFNNHQKILVVDHDRVVCGSHNWLSNRTFKNKERSFIITDSEAADHVFSNSVDLIVANPMGAA